MHSMSGMSRLEHDVWGKWVSQWDRLYPVIGSAMHQKLNVHCCCSLLCAVCGLSIDNLKRETPEMNNSVMLQYLKIKIFPKDIVATLIYRKAWAYIKFGDAGRRITRSAWFCSAKFMLKVKWALGKQTLRNVLRASIILNLNRFNEPLQPKLERFPLQTHVCPSVLLPQFSLWLNLPSNISIRFRTRMDQFNYLLYFFGRTAT